jgi:hypothetical protein
MKWQWRLRDKKYTLVWPRLTWSRMMSGNISIRNTRVQNATAEKKKLFTVPIQQNTAVLEDPNFATNCSVWSAIVAPTLAYPPRHRRCSQSKAKSRKGHSRNFFDGKNAFHRFKLSISSHLFDAKLSSSVGSVSSQKPYLENCRA